MRRAARNGGRRVRLEGWREWFSGSGTSIFLALFLLLLVEEAGVPFPLPGYAVMMYLGFRAHENKAEGVPILLVATLGVFLGSSLLYTVSYMVGRPLLARLGRFGRSQSKRIDTIERWFERRGILVVVVGRLVPNLRNPTTLAAGFLRLPPHVFVPGAGIAATLWTVGYFYLGYALGGPGSLMAGLLGIH